MFSSILRQIKCFSMKKRKQYHQILPYKRRLKIVDVTSWNILIIIIVLLIADYSHCSVIVKSYKNSNSNELLINKNINNNNLNLVQSAKELYLQNLRELLYSQLRNVSAFTTIDKVSMRVRGQTHVKKCQLMTKLNSH